MTAAWFSFIRLLPQPGSVSRARDFVRLQLFEHQLAHLSDDVELVVSELATNALVHAQTPLKVSLNGFNQTLLLKVQDDSRAGPFRVVEPRVLDTGGRGIAIVNLLTRDWGVGSRVGGGKAMWAEFDLEPRDGDGDEKSPVVQQRRPRPVTEPGNATRGTIVPSQAEGLLSNLLGDVKEPRDELRLYGRTSSAYNATRWGDW